MTELDALYLSPHLDDAALSCGGAIARRAGRGERVLVLTVFAGDEPAEPPSPFAANLARWWSLAPGTVMRARRAEDRAACEVLGADVEHWTELEAPYRRDVDGRLPYTTLGSLFRTVDPADESRIAALGARFAALPAAREVIVPLGVGGHVDHQIVRRAATACWGADLAHYEEFPYAAWKRLAVWRATRPRRVWRAEVQALTAAEVATRCRAIARYRSQVGPMFGGEERMERRVRRYVQRVGGERLWRRRGTEG